MATDSDSQSSTGQRAEKYSQHANTAFEQRLALRTAANEGAFFLPFLRPGMRVLDVGCGPGSIPLGLAERIAPGEIIGIDFQESQIAQAKALATSRGVENARFEVADVYQLPFPDSSFDATFAHVVLMHIREPLRAVKEMRRVLRPGGIAGIRDPDNGGRILTPPIPLLEQWYALALKIRQHNGGNPFMARHHRRLLLDAGFAREATVSIWSAGTLEQTSQRAVFLKVQVKGLAPTAVREGWIEQSTVAAVCAEIDAWAERPDELHFETFCEAIGWVRDSAGEVLR